MLAAVRSGILYAAERLWKSREKIVRWEIRSKRPSTPFGRRRARITFRNDRPVAKPMPTTLFLLRRRIFIYVPRLRYCVLLRFEELQQQRLGVIAAKSEGVGDGGGVTTTTTAAAAAIVFRRASFWAAAAAAAAAIVVPCRRHDVDDNNNNNVRGRTRARVYQTSGKNAVRDLRTGQRTSRVYYFFVQIIYNVCYKGSSAAYDRARLLNACRTVPRKGTGADSVGEWASGVIERGNRPPPTTRYLKKCVSFNDTPTYVFFYRGGGG